MIYALLTILILVGIIGLLWTDNMCLKEKLRDEEEINWELSAELDPVELYNLRSDDDG